MKTGRRHFLVNFIMTIAGATTLWAGAQSQVPSSQGPPFPGPRGPNNPREDAPLPPMADPQVRLKESQKTLRHDADQLLQSAQELKDEAYKTEQTSVLSLSLVHKAEEVEKLAKRIKDLVRAA